MTLAVECYNYMDSRNPFHLDLVGPRCSQRTYCIVQSSWSRIVQQTAQILPWQTPWLARHLHQGLQMQNPDRLNQRREPAVSPGSNSWCVCERESVDYYHNGTVKVSKMCSRWHCQPCSPIISIMLYSFPIFRQYWLWLTFMTPIMPFHCSLLGSTPVGLWAQAWSMKMEPSGAFWTSIA